MSLTAGTYKAKADGQCVLGTSKNKGTPFIEVYFRIIGGEHNGSRVRWTSYFTENTNERSIQSLQTCGWEGEDLSEFADGALHGLDTNEVDIVVELETYTTPEGEEKKIPRVAWVNRSGGYLNTDAAMNEEAAQSFGERMRGLVLAVKAKKPQPKPKEDDSFAFGANAPAAPEAPAGSTPPKKAF